MLLAPLIAIKTFSDSAADHIDTNLQKIEESNNRLFFFKFDDFYIGIPDTKIILKTYQFPAVKYPDTTFFMLLLSSLHISTKC